MTADPRHRLFFALQPNAGIVPRISAIRREFCPNHAIPEDHWHITLGMLSDLHSVSDALLRQLLRAGGEVDVAGFIVRLERIVGLGGWIGLRAGRKSAPLARLHRDIREAMGRAGFDPREGWSFNPHLTLGYPRIGTFSRAIDPVEWDVDQLVLIHSHLGQTRHDVIGRWDLSPELPLFQ